MKEDRHRGSGAKSKSHLSGAALVAGCRSHDAAGRGASLGLPVLRREEVEEEMEWSGQYVLAGMAKYLEGTTQTADGEQVGSSQWTPAMCMSIFWHDLTRKEEVQHLASNDKQKGGGSHTTSRQLKTTNKQRTNKQTKQYFPSRSQR